MNMNKISGKKRFYISLFVGILALFSLSFTVKEIKNASDKLASINKAKNSLENNTDAKINNEISSNYALNESLEHKKDIYQKESINNKVKSDDSKVENKGNKDILQNETNKKEDSKETIAITNRDKSIAKLTFNEEIGLMWPLKGDIVKNYSEALEGGVLTVTMDITVYRENEPFISYINEENCKNGYCNMWQKEGFHYNQMLGNERVELKDGEAICFFGERKEFLDYRVVGTH